MKIRKYTYFLSVSTVAITFVLLSGFQVLAQESSSDVHSNPSADANTLTKVDAGNALNAPGDAQVAESTDPGEDEESSSIREGGQTIDAGTVPEREQQQDNSNGDVDGDGYGDTAAVEPDYLDEDSDDDGISSKEIEIIEYQNGDDPGKRSVVVGPSSTQLLEALSMDRVTPLLQPGVRVSVTAESCDPEENSDCDEVDSEVSSPSASFGISVAGVVVRGWDPIQKESLQSRASEITTIETPNDFGIWLVARTLEDETITETDVSSDGVVVKYKTQVRLLGVIPITIPVTARFKERMSVGDITLKNSSSSEVKLEYPWYGFIVQKKTVSNQIISSTVDIADNYNASQKKEAKFKAGKALADTVK